jgi:hypothetical protein
MYDERHEEKLHSPRSIKLLVDTMEKYLAGNDVVLETLHAQIQNICGSTGPTGKQGPSGPPKEDNSLIAILERLLAKQAEQSRILENMTNVLQRGLLG